MTFLIRFFVFAALSILIGLGTAWRALDRGAYGSTRSIGPWVVWPREGSADADPYTQARVARLGLLPVNSSNHLVFTALTDSAGKELVGDCAYEVRGQAFSTLWWGLAVFGRDGSRLRNNGRTSLNSSSALLYPDGKFLVRVAPDVQPGNWLGSIRSTPIALRLTLLRPINTETTARAEEDDLPSIRRGDCS